jgi:hypothetical protein
LLAGFGLVTLLLQQAAQLRMYLEGGRIGRLVRRRKIEPEQLNGKLRLLVAADEDGRSVDQGGSVRLGCLRIRISFRSSVRASKFAFRCECTIAASGGNTKPGERGGIS